MTGGVVAAAAVTVGAACSGASAADFNAAMVKDLNTEGQSSGPRNFMNLGSKSFFAASDPATGRELWVSDGTQAGTTLVKDIYPGRYSGLYSSQSSYAAIGGVLYFMADNGNNGQELWKSDGTSVGTTMVKDIRPGGNGSYPSELTAVGSTLFFSAGTATGRELWKSDGTSGGTVLVKDIAAGSYYGYPADSKPLNLTALNGHLYFSAWDETNGRELWTSDGTEAGTALVKDISPGDSSSFSNYYYGSSPGFAVADGEIFFSAYTEEEGRELWKTDGSEAGTTLVKDINPDVYSYYYSDEGISSRPEQLTAVGDQVFFTADDGDNGEELWLTDGTEAGTQLVKNISPSYYDSPSQLTAVGSTLFFTADNGTNGRELWKSDGTNGGTTMVKDIFVGSGYYSSSYPAGLTAAGSTLYFSADNGSSGRELWKTDGTNGGTAMVRDILPGSGGSIYSYYSSEPFGVAGTKVVFAADDGQRGDEPWASDGTSSGTVLLKEINTGNLGSNPNSLTDLGGVLLFNADGDDGNFWKSDGSAAGTEKADAMLAGTSASDPQGIENIDGTLYFSAYNSGTGRELWKSDGTSAGTQLIKDLNTGSNYGHPRSSYPSDFTAIGNTIYFTAEDATNGRELWKTDGTAAGTVLVRNIRPGSSSSSPFDLTAVGTTLFFSAREDNFGRELWESDGTAGGTQLVKDIFVGSSYYSGSYPAGLTAVGSTLFFSADNDTNGRELWKSDGTSGGTTIVRDLFSGPYSSIFNSEALAELGGKIYFAASDGSTGTELWSSDGTSANTVLVKDIRPGPAGSTYSYSYYGGESLVNVDGTLYFPANNGATGTEIWKSDGTSAGTSLVQDLVPGSLGSYPSDFTKSGDRLFFSAGDDAHGTELWKGDLEAVPVGPGHGPGPGPGPDVVPVSNAFSLPKGKVNLKKGTVTVRIKLPGPGTIAAKQAPAKKKKKSPTLVKPAKAKASKAGFVNVVLKPAKAGLKKLKKRGKKPKVRKFKALMRFTYTPTGGKANSKQRSYTFKRK